MLVKEADHEKTENRQQQSRSPSPGCKASRGTTEHRRLYSVGFGEGRQVPGTNKTHQSLLPVEAIGRRGLVKDTEQ